MQQALIQAPTAEPISLEQAICHIREDTDDAQNDLIRSQIRTARQYVEDYTRNALVRQVWKVTCSSFPRVIELPIVPVRKVSSIQYVDSAGSTQTWATSKYQVDYLSSDRVRIAPVYGEVWPSVQPGTFNAVTVEFIAGHAIPFSSDYSSDANQLDATAHPLSDDDVLQVWSTGTQLPDGLATYTNYHVVNSTTAAFELSLTSGGSPVALTSDGEGQHFAGLPPDPILSAMLLLVGHLYENREQSIIGVLNEIPFGIQSLLMPNTSVRF